ncbi:hypothetical protein ABEB36_002263 [Hypothenemus hampei]|uniref:CDAN1-interacting nuclease 1 n=1 Tax=Hypothenemus hampei TaxID=57062 RepID=A0ABD1F7Q2_HYPHA
MEVGLYKEIVSKMRNFRGLPKNCLKQLEESFPSVKPDTLSSIVNNEYQKKMKYGYGKTQNNRNLFWEMYNTSLKRGEEPGILVRLAEIHDIPPCLLARLILQKYFEVKPGKFLEKDSTVNINKYLKNACLISDPDLAYEVFLCSIFDNLYSPLQDAIRMSIGQQYEIRLHKEATQLGLTFRNEEYLRKLGYDKTPDLKMELPFLFEGIVINWIESKALFADEEVHNDYVKNQYLSYWNRFGPGLVIYWFGYLKTIVEPSNKRFIIRDHLPTNIIKFNDVNQL